MHLQRQSVILVVTVECLCEPLECCTGLHSFLAGVWEPASALCAESLTPSTLCSTRTSALMSQEVGEGSMEENTVLAAFQPFPHTAHFAVIGAERCS